MQKFNNYEIFARHNCEENTRKGLIREIGCRIHRLMGRGRNREKDKQRERERDTVNKFLYIQDVICFLGVNHKSNIFKFNILNFFFLGNFFVCWPVYKGADKESTH